MNAKTFLAIVDKHPLPWSIHKDDRHCHDSYDDANGACVTERDGDDEYREDAVSVDDGLGQAAPQMAAAILRFLEAEDRGYGMDFNDPADAGAYCEARAALYDSLPKDLRP